MIINGLLTSMKQHQLMHKQNKVKYELLTITIMGKVSKETKREQRYNANLHNIFVKAQEEIANK